VRRALVFVLFAAVAAACTTDVEPKDGPDAFVPLRMNEIQVLGSHNSYRQAMPPDLLALVRAFDADTADSLDYSHPSLTEQLTAQGARQLELDVFPDPEGGLYAERRALVLIDEPTASGEPALDAPGFKVLHAADLDFESTCLTLVACLTEVKVWSDEHPTHLPLLVLLEAKYTATLDPAALGFVDPPDFDVAMFDALDAEIRSVFGADELVVPADVDPVDGWPELGFARGRVWFALDNADLAGGYEGSLLFVEGDHFAKRNDPLVDDIAGPLADGLIVRTRADADTVQARTNDVTTRDAALASGAQYVSTDYLVADPRFGDYAVALPGRAIARCNPVTAPPRCTADQLKE
jgi:hypothetical protein